MMKSRRLNLQSLKKAQLLLIALITLLWPVVIYCAFKLNAETYLATVMIIFFSWRVVAIGKLKKQGRILQKAAKTASVAVIMLALGSFLLNRYTLLRYYPVAVNAVFLGIFVFSLIKPPTAITCIAMLTEKKLTPALVNYTFKVTCIWCLFFAVNGMIALFTAIYGDQDLWLLWNGLISYLIAGAIMGGEFLIRMHIKEHAD